MFVLDFLIAFLIALLLTAIFGGGLRGHRRGAELIFFFVILLLATWAGGMWITPFGPTIWGVSWVSFLVVGLFFALLLTAVTAPADIRPTQSRAKKRQRRVALLVFDMFFWILAGAMIIVIILGYLR